MTAMRFLTDLRERSTNLWDRLSTRSQMLQMLELLNQHEKATADLLESPPAAPVLVPHTSGHIPDNIVLQRFGLEKQFVHEKAATPDGPVDFPACCAGARLHSHMKRKSQAVFTRDAVLLPIVQLNPAARSLHVAL